MADSIFNKERPSQDQSWGPDAVVKRERSPQDQRWGPDAVFERKHTEIFVESKTTYFTNYR